jgi:hypothetical protein
MTAPGSLDEYQAQIPPADNQEETDTHQKQEDSDCNLAIDVRSRGGQAGIGGRAAVTGAARTARTACTRAA